MFKDVIKWLLITIPVFITLLLAGIHYLELLPLPFIFLFLSITYLTKNLARNALFECPRCGNIFSVTPITFLLAPHQLYYKLLRCPNCMRVSWCEIRFYKGKEVKSKRTKLLKDREIPLNFFYLMVSVVYLLYIFQLIVSLFKPELVLVVMSSFLVFIYTLIILYPIYINYRSQIYAMITFFVSFAILITTVIQIWS
jgi:hypothetical protein